MAKGKSGNWFGRHKIFSALGVIILIIIIVSAASNGGSSPGTSIPAKTDNSEKASTQPVKKVASPQTLLNLSGSGTKQTRLFTAANSWDLHWSYDCSNFGGQGNFIVSVYDKSGSPSLENSDVNQLGGSGSDVQHYYQGGTFYLSINSECSWKVKVVG
ncbi:MAG TPA: hypothetical protein VHD84_01190 [Candidatus Saccharimonadales bacterium]|nr:hypothetical protein [Candidatus Saccharimonadales bacterium]